jgi:hypothetical protein
LGWTGYKSQQTDQPRDPDQPANLWEPADGPQGRDFDTHGIFDAKSTSRSYQLWASQHHGPLGAVGAAALLGLLAARAGSHD